MTKILPLFSNNFKEVLTKLNTLHDSKIGKYLHKVNCLIEGRMKIGSISDPSDFWNLVAGLCETEVNTLINDSIRMLDIRTSTSDIDGQLLIYEISFLPKGKEPNYSTNNKWDRQNRQTGKPTRLLKRLINSKEFTDADFEVFNNQLKALVDFVGDFEIVSDTDITFWYHEDQYDSYAGSLGNSCMRLEDCQSFFTIYEEYARMLILLKDNKILGRALLWTVGEKIYMDRIYTTKDYIIPMFINYAQKHRWCYRSNQALLRSGDSVTWKGPTTNYRIDTEIDLRIDIDNYSQMPYMDSFRYYNREQGYITTTPLSQCVFLDNTEGYLEELIMYSCYCCGENEFCNEDDGPDDLRWSKRDAVWYCLKCAVWSYINREWLSTKTAERVHISLDRNDYLTLDNLDNNCDYVCIDEKWYSINHESLVRDVSTGIYHLKL